MVPMVVCKGKHSLQEELPRPTLRASSSAGGRASALIPLRAKALATRAVPNLPMAGITTLTRGSLIATQEPSARRIPNCPPRISVTAAVKGVGAAGGGPADLTSCNWR